MTNNQEFQESKKLFGANVQEDSNGAIVALAPMDMSPRKGCIKKHDNGECAIREYPSGCRCRGFQTSSRDSGRVYKAELDNQVWSCRHFL